MDWRCLPPIRDGSRPPAYYPQTGTRWATPGLLETISGPLSPLQAQPLQNGLIPEFTKMNTATKPKEKLSHSSPPTMSRARNPLQDWRFVSRWIGQNLHARRRLKSILNAFDFCRLSFTFPACHRASD